MRIHAYVWESGQLVGEWDSPASVELAWTINGPDAGEIVMPKNSSHLKAERLIPGGTGVYVEVDARDEGLDLWGGRAETLEQDSTAAQARVGLVGPRGWLEQYSVPAMTKVFGSAARIVKEVIRDHPGALRIKPGDMAEGDGAEMVLQAQSILTLMDALAADRSEEWTLHPIPSKIEFELEWRKQISAPESQVSLVEGVNSEWNGGFNLSPSVEELWGVASSFMSGQDVAGSVARGSRVIGRKAALAATVRLEIAERLLGQGSVESSPATDTKEALEAELMAALRRVLSPRLAAAVEVTDIDLWSRIRPGALVQTRFSSEATGLFQDAIARVMTMSASPVPPKRMQLAVELWEP